MILKFVFRRIFRRRASSVPEPYISPDRLAFALRERDSVGSDYRPGVVIHFADRIMVRGKCYVVDGDTIRIGQKRIRLEGIDAPEMDQPLGPTAKRELIRLCKGQIITVQVSGEDVHGRLVGICYLPDGRDLSAEMVRIGLALDWAYFSGGKYAHLEPVGARRKLWQQDHLQTELSIKYQSVTVVTASV